MGTQGGGQQPGIPPGGGGGADKSTWLKQTNKITNIETFNVFIIESANIQELFRNGKFLELLLS